MTEEISFYSDNSGVRVTNTRVIIRNVTYAMANIASVRSEVTKPSLVGPLVAILLGVVFVLGGIGGRSSAGAVFGGILVLPGIVWWRGIKPIWHLRISSASGESTPLSSTNQSWVESIAHAINEAIIHRG